MWKRGVDERCGQKVWMRGVDGSEDKRCEGEVWMRGVVQRCG